jgi:site-specific recombinase XerD
MSKPKFVKYTFKNKGINHIFQEFLERLELDKRSDSKTVKAYRTDVFYMLEYLNENNKKLFDKGNCKKLERTHLEAWVDYLVNKKKYAESTIRRKKIAMRQFLIFLFEEEYITVELHQFFEIKKNTYKVPKDVPTPKEVSTYIESINSNNTFLQNRDVLMIKLMYQTGVRTTELVNIKKSDFKGYLNNNSKTDKKEHFEHLDDVPEIEHSNWVGLILIEGKRGKHRYVLFSGELYKALKEYQNNRLFKSHSNYLFHSTHNKPMTRQNFYNRVKKYTKNGTFNPKKFTPHQFRHAFGTHNLKRPTLTGEESKDSVGLEIYELAELMGHSNLKATMIYTHLDNQTKRQYYKKYHPRS